MTLSYGTSINHTCPQCRQEFRSSHALESHRESAHATPSGRTLHECESPHCDERFYPENGDHGYCSVQCIPDGTTVVTCPGCGDDRTVRNRFRHCDSTDYCAECKKTMTTDQIKQASDASADREPWANEALFACVNCGGVFISRTDKRSQPRYCSNECRHDDSPEFDDSDLEQVLVTSAHSHSYHIPKPDDPETALCGRSSEKFRLKNPAVHPHRTLCENCTEATRPPAEKIDDWGGVHE